MTPFGKKQKKYMTNYIVNKTTTEMFAVVADSLLAAMKTVEQGNGVPVNVALAYNARLQTQPAAPQSQPILPGQPISSSLRPIPLPSKVASKKS